MCETGRSWENGKHGGKWVGPYVKLKLGVEHIVF